jgi:hypothetical protein
VQQETYTDGDRVELAPLKTATPPARTSNPPLTSRNGTVCDQIDMFNIVAGIRAVNRSTTNREQRKQTQTTLSRTHIACCRPTANDARCNGDARDEGTVEEQPACPPTQASNTSPTEQKLGRTQLENAGRRVLQARRTRVEAEILAELQGTRSRQRVLRPRL